MALVWEPLTSYHDQPYYNLVSCYRARVPGGWLVNVDLGAGSGTIFYPDPNHEWDGNSL